MAVAEGCAVNGQFHKQMLPDGASLFVWLAAMQVTMRAA